MPTFSAPEATTRSSTPTASPSTGTSGGRPTRAAPCSCCTASASTRSATSELAQELVRAGYTVYADDHLGHGATGLGQWDGDHTKLGRLGPSGLRGAVEAVVQLTGIIRDDAPGPAPRGARPLVGLADAAEDRRRAGLALRRRRAQRDRVPGARQHERRRPQRPARPPRHDRLRVAEPRPGRRRPRWRADPLAVDAKVATLFGWRDALRLLRPSGEAARPRRAAADPRRRRRPARRRGERPQARRRPTSRAAASPTSSSSSTTAPGTRSSRRRTGTRSSPTSSPGSTPAS